MTAIVIEMNNVGGLARALIHLWKDSRTFDWLNRPVFLSRR
jgi:hypothetical protein